MKTSSFAIVMLACLQVGISGCQRAAHEKPEAAAASTQTGDDNETKESGQSEVNEKTTPQGWILYSPPEKDFS